MPEVLLGHQPPPSTLFPCHAWFFQRRSPFFCGSKTSINKDFIPVESTLLVEFVEKGMPHLDEDSCIHPLIDSPPAGTWRWKFVWQVAPAGTASQHPQNAFKALSVICGRTASFRRHMPLGNKGLDVLPLLVGKQNSFLRHRSTPFDDELTQFDYPAKISLRPSFETASREILIISTPNDLPLFERLLGNGDDFGVLFEYRIQERSRGLADAFIVGRSFIGDSRVALVLGDNIFYGQGFQPLSQRATERISGATIFAYPVADPERYGVVEFDDTGKVIGIEEKPVVPKSNYAVPGL